MSEHARPSRPGSPTRVRHEVRDGVAVVAFSAAASTALALALRPAHPAGGLGAA